MAQSGKHGTLLEIDVSKLGEISGSGGLIGSYVSGYQYFPLKDEVNFENVIPMLVVDKIRVPSNLPNRTTPDSVENQTAVIDVYVGVTPNTLSDITTISPTIDPVFIPAHLITKIAALPKVECCVDEADPPLLTLVPNPLDLGTYNEDAPEEVLPTDVEGVVTLVYSSLSGPVNITFDSVGGSGGSSLQTFWAWKKSSDTTYIPVGADLSFSLAELSNGNGYLDIDVKFEVSSAYSSLASSAFSSTFDFIASSSLSGVPDATGEVTIAITNNSGR